MLTRTAARSLTPDTLVSLTTEPLELPEYDGDLPETVRMGPGIVREAPSGGQVHVHWIEADCESWMRPSDLRAMPTAGKLITIYRYYHGRRTLVRHRLIFSKGLQHHWMVELLPNDIVRAVRADGLAWTFNWHPLLNRVDPIRRGDLDQPEDDDAEALTVVDTALEIPDWTEIHTLVEA